FDRELDAVNRGRKAGDEEALRDAGKNFVELAAYGALAGRVPGALDVGGILKEREDAFFAVLGETVQVEEAIVRGSGINFEIAGMNDDPERSVNGQRDAIYQAVGYRNGMNGEGAKAEALTSPNFVQVGIVEEFVFFELVFDVGERELGAVHRNVDFGEDPGQAADVIFVAVGEDNGANLVAVLDQVGDVGNNDVHAEQFGLREHQAGVNDDDVVTPAHGHAVHAELTQPAQRNDLQLTCRHDEG